MRIRALTLFSALLIQLSWSIPALDHYYTVTQPDGSTIEVHKKGNEHHHYVESKDGKILKKDKFGFFRPTVKDSIAYHFKDTTTKADEVAVPMAKAPQLSKAPSYQSTREGEQNVLVILVQFNDTKFFSDTPQEDISLILSQEGFSDNNSAGSAVDYFKDNSLGKFVPIFDVVGPITVSGNNYSDYGSLSANKDYGAQKALTEALDSLKKRGTVDFKKYDNNGDGFLDYVHMIYAGFGSHDSDQDSAIWPHKWIFANPKNLGSGGRFSSGPYVIEYACNAERDGLSHSYNPNAKKYFGVGNFIHEFSHLLGLPDLYPTDGSDRYTLSIWDVMDMGAYNTTNLYGPIGTSPPYYSSFERMSLGWMTPDDLIEAESDTLTALQNNVARQLKNPTDESEFFILEYRNKNKWDKALPNHGMLIWHIDYKKDVWESATINNTEHQHVDIIEADGVANKNSQTADVFPGTTKKKVASFNKFITWDEVNLGYQLDNISESTDYSYITFNVRKITSETDSTEISSSSGTDDNSSSSQEESSSSTVQESSSSTPEELSSSSLEESSSSTTENSSSSEDVTFFVSGNQLHTHSNISGLKTLHIFSLNGQLLEKMQFEGNNLPLNLKKYKQPLLLSVSQNGKAIGRTLFIFRE